MDLTQLRDEIDQIDSELVRLFCQRMDVAAKIADYKKAHNLPIANPGREREVLQKVANLAGDEMCDYIRVLYPIIFELSRGYQSKRNSSIFPINKQISESIENTPKCFPQNLEIYPGSDKTSLMKCGLLGRKLGHSYSPQIHKYLGEYSYELFEKEPEELAEFIRKGDFTGINVTIPYKKDVIPFLDELSDTALKMGSVNTVVRRPDGSLFGHNTDYFGFVSMVKRSGVSVSGKKVLVLGSGGTSNTAVNALQDLGAYVVIISRSGENHYGNLHLHQDASVIVNTTPVGMYPNNGECPIDLSEFPDLEGVLDVIYNPAKTQLLLEAEKLGIPHQNGLWMLVAQAKEAAEYFGNTSLPDSIIERVYQKLSNQMQNIILIGMPGCGKSTIASLLAQYTGRKVVDSDQEIVKLAGKSISDIFADDGETVFRTYETKVLSELGKQSQLILATGGGCVTQPCNYPLLHQNGNIFWLKRDLDLLPTEGRPLSQTTKLNKMYEIRKAMYETFANYTIDNNADLENTVNQIIAILEETK